MTVDFVIGSKYLEISKNRKAEIEVPKTAELLKKKIRGFNNNNEFSKYLNQEKKPILVEHLKKGE